MRLAQPNSRRWTTLLWLVLLTVALIAWLVQPWILSALLGLEEFQDDGRIAVLKQWAAGRFAPMTIVGLLSLFPVSDLLLAVFLLAAILVLLINFLGRSPDGRRGSWLPIGSSQRSFRRFRFRFGMMLALIALLGVECGWEAVEWKKWQLRERYLSLADGYASSAIQSRGSLRRIHVELTRLDADADLVDDAPAPDAVSHERQYFENQFVHTFALIKAFDERAHKYGDAAKHPLEPIPPDPPLPRRPSDSQTIAEGYAGDRGRILAAYDELVRSYPQLENKARRE